MKAFQDFYPDELSHCFGCGRNNERGHQLKSHWDGEITARGRVVAVRMPDHMLPGHRRGSDTEHVQ